MIEPAPQASTSPVALITGASHRIGLAITEKLHQIGYRVIIHYLRSKTSASKLSDELNQKRPNSAMILKADLNNANEVGELAANTLRGWGRVDLLINNASLFEADSTETETTRNWQLTLNINLSAAYLLSDALKEELKRRGGNILNLVDIYADRPLKSHTAYSVSKAGITMLTKSLALELAPEVRVNGIAPGAILWPETAPSEEVKQAILNKVPLTRLGSTEAIVKTALYLLECDYVTGQIIQVDGGRSITI